MPGTLARGQLRLQRCPPVHAPRVPYGDCHGEPGNAGALQRWGLEQGFASCQARAWRVAAASACSLIESQPRACACAWRAAELCCYLLGLRMRQGLCMLSWLHLEVACLHAKGSDISQYLTGPTLKEPLLSVFRTYGKRLYSSDHNCKQHLR